MPPVWCRLSSACLVYLPYTPRYLNLLPFDFGPVNLVGCSTTDGCLLQVDHTEAYRQVTSKWHAGCLSDKKVAKLRYQQFIYMTNADIVILHPFAAVSIYASDGVSV